MTTFQVIYGLLALVAVFMTATALPAAGIVAFQAHRTLRSKVLLLLSVLYSFVFLLEPPIPLQMFLHSGDMSFITAMRYILLGATLLFVWSEYVHTIRHAKQAQLDCEVHLKQLADAQAEIARLKGETQ